MHGLGLDVGIGHHKRALAHHRKHRRRRCDLSESAGDDPRPEHVWHLRQCLARCDQYAGEKEQREWKTEEKTDVSGTDRPKRCGQLALHGVARGLRRRGNQRKDGPVHSSVFYTLMPGHPPGIHVLVEGRDKPGSDAAGIRYAALARISAASGNSVTAPFSLSISRNRSKYRIVGAPPVRSMIDCRHSSLCAFLAASTEGQI